MNSTPAVPVKLRSRRPVDERPSKIAIVVENGGDLIIFFSGWFVVLSSINASPTAAAMVSARIVLDFLW